MRKISEIQNMLSEIPFSSGEADRQAMYSVADEIRQLENPRAFVPQLFQPCRVGRFHCPRGNARQCFKIFIVLLLIDCNAWAQLRAHPTLLIRDDLDFARHIDYVHFDPLKYGLLKRVGDWPFSTFHRYVDAGIYVTEWFVDASLEVGGGNCFFAYPALTGRTAFHAASMKISRNSCKVLRLRPESHSRA